MVLFCTVGAPLVLVAAIAYLWFGNILGMNLRPVLLMLEKLKEWVMLDIYLVGIGVASIKVQDYAFLQPGVGLIAFVLVILSILTLIHLNVEQLWERFYPQRPANRPDEKLRVCLGCHFTGFRIREVAARAAISRCAIAAVRAYKNAGLRLSPRWFFCFRLICFPSRWFTSMGRDRKILSCPALCPWQTATLPWQASCLSPVFWCHLPKLL
jgi:uncharacterized paraquat-inducible protein A